LTVIFNLSVLHWVMDLIHPELFPLVVDLVLDHRELLPLVVDLVLDHRELLPLVVDLVLDHREILPVLALHFLSTSPR